MILQECQDDWYQKFLDGVAENYRRIVVPVGNLRRREVGNRYIGHAFMTSLADFGCVYIIINIPTSHR